MRLDYHICKQSITCNKNNITKKIKFVCLSAYKKYIQTVKVCVGHTSHIILYAVTACCPGGGALPYITSFYLFCM